MNAGRECRGPFGQCDRAGTLRVLGKIAIPTLVLLASSDDHSRIETRAAAREVAAPQVRIELLEGYGHMRWSDEEAASVIRRTVEFLLASESEHTLVDS